MATTPRKTPHFWGALAKYCIGALFIMAIFTAVIITGYLFLQNKIYPGIYAAGVHLGFLTTDQAEQKLKDTIGKRLNKSLTFIYAPDSQEETRRFEVTFSENSVDIKYSQVVEKAFSFGHHSLFFPKVNVDIEPKFNMDFENQVRYIAQNVDQSPIDSQLKIEENNIQVTPSQDGFVLDQQELQRWVWQYVLTGIDPSTSLPVKRASPKLSYEKALKIKNRLDQIKLSPIKIRFKSTQSDTIFQDTDLGLEEVAPLIDLENSKTRVASGHISNQSFEITSIKINDRELTNTNLALDKEKTVQFLQKFAQNIDQSVEEPLFEFSPNSPGRIKEFRPPREGRKLQIELAADILAQALPNQGQAVIDLPVEITKPKNALTNELGIEELIGRGISNFAGSISNRVYNIKLAASKINGILVPPGETFSFNNTVGDISAATGYKQAYVIKEGRTVLDDGGGVCQVSTTLFRTVLNSGLPVVARTAHAYRVSYYEQGFPSGLDATIFHPSVDFKFKNDTPTHILIQAYTVGTSLYMDFYGTPDGRVSVVSTPVTTNQTKPPDPLYQDDPTLPKGTVKQVDWSAWGANVVFSRKVTRNGQTLINDTFRSNYRPWQAVFLVGTQ